MCGRYTIRRPGRLAKLIYQEQFEEFSETRMTPRFNIAPSQDCPIVRMDHEGKLAAGMAKWGLVPSWTRGKPKLAPINAKCETAATSGMFRQAMAKRRCLVPADGFYEWKGAAPPKQPFFIRLRDDEPFAFAGLWERWKGDETSEPVDTFTILTTTPNELMRPLHNRMPVILHQRDFERWLDRNKASPDVADLLKPYESDAMEAWPVSTRVN